MNKKPDQDPLEDTDEVYIGWLGEDSAPPPAPAQAPRPPEQYQQEPPPPPQQPPPAFRPEPVKRKRRRGRGCFSFLLAMVILLAIYLLLPFNTRILILGTDSRDPNNPLGRTDTMILTSVDPLEPKIAMFSVPRDLWINIPGYGENRINTAYFFAEADAPGTGIEATIDTIEANFGVRMEYTVLIKFAGIVNVVDAMGGVNVDLPRAMSGYDEGTHRLSGTEALAFVRDRAGSDDFFRMERGQLFIRGMIKSFLDPATLVRLPAIVLSIPSAVETDLPYWHWPRIAVALLRAGPDGIDGRTVDRDMATPFTTSQGASVLLPNWELIWPVVNEMFR